MSKEGEKQYFQKIGEEGVARSLNKPYSEASAGQLMAQMAAIFIVLPAPPATLLDMGCGTGWTSQMFARRGYTVTGQDIAADAIEIARRDAQKQGLPIEFVAGDYEGADFGGNYDAVVFFDCLHHAVDEKAALKAAYDALKPGGICVTSEPGKGHGRGAEAEHARAEYGVTERDMPPTLIRASGLAVGFKKAVFYADPAHLNKAAYYQAASPAKKKLLGTPFIGGALRVLHALHSLTINKRHWGLVVLEK